MNFNELQLKKNQAEKILKINDKEIKIKQYLPISEKLDIVEIALQESKEQDGLYNEAKLDVFFNLNIVYSYTDLIFTQQEYQNPLELYDILQSNNIFELVINEIDDTEYNSLLSYLNEVKNSMITYKYSAAGLIQTIIQDLPKNAAEAAQIVENFNPEKYQEVINFAKAANNNQPIPITKV